MEIKKVKIEEIKPYKKNPRKNEKAVDIVADSIKEFGFRNPIILDKDNVIVAGHTRFTAARQLNIREVPVLYATDLTPEQVKAFRIMDNKSTEYSYWDYDLLKQEILSLESLNVAFFNPDKDGQANDSYTEWRKGGGLDYGNEDKTGFQTILLHFKEEKDVAEFAKLIKQNITNRTKYLWYPKQPEDKVANAKYVE